MMRLNLLPVMCVAAALGFGQTDSEKRLDDAAVMLQEVMEIPDSAIPQDLLDKAECVVLIPGMKKGAFLFGAKYGRGFVLCRKKDGVGWSAPGAVRVEGGSFGLQIGGSETDVIMLVLNESGVKRLMSSKFTLGGDAAVAAGPVGRSTSAQTDAYMRAEILTWSRSRGVFAGVSLQGATLRQELSVNKEFYGKEYRNAQIVQADMAPPRQAARLLSLLNKYSSRKGR